VQRRSAKSEAPRLAGASTAAKTSMAPPPSPALAALVAGAAVFEGAGSGVEADGSCKKQFNIWDVLIFWMFVVCRMSLDSFLETPGRCDGS